LSASCRLVAGLFFAFDRIASRIQSSAIFKYAPAPAAPSSVDVEAVLDDLLAQKKARLNWRHSIVDLMKLLELASSLAARKELATELHYTGAKDGSAEMNIWLHKAVMQKLAENGGKVPESLKH
jgi:hypothetical protein